MDHETTRRGFGNIEDEDGDADEINAGEVERSEIFMHRFIYYILTSNYQANYIRGKK